MSNILINIFINDIINVFINVPKDVFINALKAVLINDIINVPKEGEHMFRIENLM